MADDVEGAIEGHLHPSHLLSPRRAFTRLGEVVHRIVDATPIDPWERDTATLSPALARHRRRMRAFARAHLAPLARAVDLAPHPPPGETTEGARALLRTAAFEGLLTDLLPRPLGSMELALAIEPLPLPQALKTEELAAVDGGLMLLLCAHDLGLAPIVLSASTSALRRLVLPAFRECARGEPHLFAYAITEPAAGSDVEEGTGARARRPGTIARRVDGGFVLRGRKCFISGGDLAQSTVVFAALEGEGIESWTAFLVRAGSPGFEVARTELKMGMRASGAAELELDDVFVPDDRVIGGVRGGWALNRATLNLSRIPVAAMAVGFARAATEHATRFACATRLGRKRLVDYQDVQLAVAEMHAETQAARAMVWDVARRRPTRQGEAAAAKFHCTDVARRVCESAMDLMGNHAVLHENEVERVLRDARLTQIFEGTNQINRLAWIEDEQERLLSLEGR